MKASFAFCCAGDMACCGPASAIVRRSVLMIIGPPGCSVGEGRARCQRRGDEGVRHGVGTPTNVVNALSLLRTTGGCGSRKHRVVDRDVQLDLLGEGGKRLRDAAPGTLFIDRK